MMHMGQSGSGGGTLIYRRNSILLLSDVSTGAPLRFVSQELGLSNVEVLDEQPDGGFAASILSPPPLDGSASRVPIGLAVYDVTGDGLEDVLVSDTAGNWLAIGGSDGSFASVDAETMFGSFDPTPELAFLSGDGIGILTGGLTTSFQLELSAASTGSWSPPLEVSLPGPWLNVGVTPQVIGLADLDAGAPLLAFAGASQLDGFALADAGSAPITSTGTWKQASLFGPYVDAFDAFDHLQVLPLAGCGPTALGVGVFAGNPAGVPRQLEQLAFGSSTYSVQEISTSFDVDTLAVVPDSNGGAVVGVLGEANEGGDGGVFAAYRLTSCNAWLPLAITSTDFDWRSASASVSKNDGVQLLGVDGGTSANGAERYRFIHYDGFNVRIWEADVLDGTSPTVMLSFDESAVHAERSDVAF